MHYILGAIFILVAWKILSFIFDGVSLVTSKLASLIGNFYDFLYATLGGTILFLIFILLVILATTWLIRSSFRLEEKIQQKELEDKTKKLENENRLLAERQAAEAARQAAEQAKSNLKSKINNDYNNHLEKLTSSIIELIDKHRDVLIKKRKQSLSTDDYGITVGLSTWQSELDYFAKNVALPDPNIKQIIDSKASIWASYFKIDNPYLSDEEITNLEQGDILEDIEYIKRLANECIEGFDIVAKDSDINSMQGSTFEAFCQQLLENNGWSVVRKGGTGDQGVDLIANRSGISVAIQCKRYSKPVGNKAIQEVEAGRQFENAKFAVVVSNAAYTPSAKQLANALGVLLLHYTELDRLHHFVTPN